MNKYDLSILIPARNEMFLARTIEDILRNIRGKTEIIVVLDGAWANPRIPEDERITIVYRNKSIGQRAATNEACRLSKAKYVMKVDAHCAFDEGFDVKLMADMQDDITMIPKMYNLHVFDWVCKVCNKRTYQGPTPKQCFTKDCPGIPEREIVWKPRSGTRNWFYRFDNTLHFQYWSARKNHADSQGDLVETMSAQGSCFLLTREKYWELNICDEEHGSWGQQGTEIACATWLSGGRVISNKKTWYAHMFRTQGGDFGFPYPQSTKKQEAAREYSRDLWFNNKHMKQIRPLSWLLEKFWPIEGWNDEDLAKAKKKGEEFYNKSKATGATSFTKGKSKGIIFYTDNQVNLRIAGKVQNNLRKIGLPIVSASLKPMPNLGKNVHIKLKRGYLTMFKQQLAALEASDADIIYMCEHDVLYHPSHFDFTPPEKDVFYYNVNLWKIRAEDGHALQVDVCRQVSGLVAYRTLLIGEYKKRIKRLEETGKFERAWGFEPGTKMIKDGGFSDYSCDNFRSKYPNLDIRAKHNLTANRWRKEEFRNQQNTIGWTESALDKILGWNLPNSYFAS